MFINSLKKLSINPIPVELWNDASRRGRAIMARIEFLPFSFNDEGMILSKICFKIISLVI